ncbi:hypothetical protein ACPPVT_04705 [Angustibacter sp. McL0619]
MEPTLPVRRPAEVDIVDLRAVEARLAEVADLNVVLSWLDAQD